MRNQREQLIAGVTGDLGIGESRAQRLFARPLLGDIARGADRAFGRAVRSADDLGIRLDPADSTVRILHPKLVMIWLTCESLADLHAGSCAIEWINAIEPSLVGDRMCFGQMPAKDSPGFVGPARLAGD